MQNPSSQASYEQPVLAVAERDVSSAVSWAAITGGTFITVALMLVFLALGSGLGLATEPLWHAHASVSHFTYMTASWLIVTQWISAGLGGYLTGRLRTKWTGVHTHEVFFRDTAHGLLTWAVATVFYTSVALILASSLAAGSMHLRDQAIGAASIEEDTSESNPLSAMPDAIDEMFRTDASSPNLDADTKKEVMRIITKGVRVGTLSDLDNAELAQISTRIGLSPNDAVARADDAVTQIRASLDSARRTAASVSIFTALSMLIGAFVACISSALGGLRRDEARLLSP